MANIVRRSGGQENQAQQQAALAPFRVVRELLGWDPFRVLEGGVSGYDDEAVFIPRFDVKETKDAFVIKADLPGIREEDVEISVTGNRLRVSGKREVEREQEDERYYAFERSFGAFMRSFTLPDGADPESVRAEMKDGVLTLVVPKKPEFQPKRISVSRSGNGGIAAPGTSTGTGSSGSGGGKTTASGNTGGTPAA